MPQAKHRDVFITQLETASSLFDALGDAAYAPLRECVNQALERADAAMALEDPLILAAQWRATRLAQRQALQYHNHWDAHPAAAMSREPQQRWAQDVHALASRVEDALARQICAIQSRLRGIPPAAQRTPQLSLAP